MKSFSGKWSEYIETKRLIILNGMDWICFEFLLMHTLANGIWVCTENCTHFIRCAIRHAHRPRKCSKWLNFHILNLPGEKPKRNTKINSLKAANCVRCVQQQQQRQQNHSVKQIPTHNFLYNVEIYWKNFAHFANENNNKRKMWNGRENERNMQC